MPARSRPKSPRRAQSPAGDASQRRRAKPSTSGTSPRQRTGMKTVESSLPLEVPPAHELAAIFRHLDSHGHGALSIGEVDRAVAELYGKQGSAYRPALQRAFHAADATSGGSLGLAEFCLFFEYLVYFQVNWATFEQIERSCGDGLTMESLMDACKKLGHPLQRTQALTTFQLMANSSTLAGRISMDAFCRWSAQWHVERSAETVATVPPSAPANAIDLENTSVHMFGKNNAGQLGLGHWSSTQRTPDQPVRLPRIDLQSPVPRLIKKVACGGRHTVILSTAGELWSFGANEQGQLGMGIAQPMTTRAAGMHASATSSYTTPQRVRGSTPMLRTGVRDIACGDSFSVLIDGDGALWGWGDNRRGQLGYPSLSRQSHARQEGATNQALRPTKFRSSAAGAVQAPALQTVAAGHSHCAAISQQGTLWSWGWNEDGQLGLEHLDTFRCVPQQVRGALSDKVCTTVGCGDRHTVVAAFDATGETDRGASLAYSFGSNVSGQLGIGKEKGDMGFAESVPIPQQVVFNPDLEWGLGKTRDPPRSTSRSRARAETRPRSRSPAAVRRREQESGHERGAYLGGGDYVGGGPRPNMQRLADHPSELGLSVLRIACGARHTLAVLEHTDIAGRGNSQQQSRKLSVWSWGQNNKGQLGLASNEGVAASGGCGNMSIPHRVVAVDQMSNGDLSGAHVSCGQSTSYVAVHDKVYVWGNNHAGQLGVTTETQDSIHLISKKQKDTDKARVITFADITRASAGDPEASGSEVSMCVAAGSDHAAIWIDSSSSAVIADDTRGSKPLRFDDCSLPRKCEIAVMGHDPVLLADCIQQVVRDRSTAVMEKPLQQRIDHLQKAWDGAASGTTAADGSSRDATFLLSLEAAQATAAAAVEAEVPRTVMGRSRSTSVVRTADGASPSSVRTVASRSASRSTPRGSASFRASPKLSRRSPARTSPAQRHQSPRRPTGARAAKTSHSASVVAPSAATNSSPMVSTVASFSSPSALPATPIERVATLESEVVLLKSEVVAIREDMIGLRGDVASMAQDISRAVAVLQSMAAKNEEHRRS